MRNKHPMYGKDHKHKDKTKYDRKQEKLDEFWKEWEGKSIPIEIYLDKIDEIMNGCTE